MQGFGRWFEIALGASFLLLQVAAVGLYFMSGHRIIVGQWGP